MNQRIALFGSALLAVSCSVGALGAGAGAAGAGPSSAVGAATSANGSLTSVSCATATACTAVGFATVGGVQVPLAESWNGRAWAVGTLPKAAGFAEGALHAVSCASATRCTAVGRYDDDKGAQLMLAYGWNGKAWAVEATPAPSDYFGQSLFGVSCPSVTGCFAVGSYFQGSGARVTIAEHWNGKTWTKQATPPGTARNLQSVDCTSTTDCTAVGNYVKGASAELALAEHWNGGSWADEVAPTPAGSVGSYPGGIACPSSAACVSVGYYESSAAYLSEVEAWNGKAWSLQTTPKPAKGDSTFLAAVSCPDAGVCVAAGYGQDASGNAATLVMLWNGRTWTISPTIKPAGASTANLFGVSCSAADACTAVGSYQKGSAALNFAERWNGKTWAVQSVPNG